MTNTPLSPNTNHEGQLFKFCRIFFLIVAVLGSALYYWKGNTMAGGIGLSASLFSLVSFFHFNKLQKREGTHIDTKMTWFLLIVTIIGVLLIFLNKMQGGPHFYYGIGGGMAMIGGIAYGLELLYTWLAQVK